MIACVLFVLGAALLANSKKEEPVQAQGGANYSANWRATQLLVTRMMAPDVSNEPKCRSLNPPLLPYGEPASSEVAIGPSQWEVKGIVDSTTKFKEVWTVTTFPSAFTWGDGRWEVIFGNFRHCVNLKLRVIGTYVSDDWVIGYLHAGNLPYTTMTFRTVSVADQLTGTSNYPDGNVYNIGKTTSCQRTNRCIYSSGPYAWTTFHEIDEASDGKHQNLGVLMPTRWNVTGYLCNPGDNRCD